MMQNRKGFTLIELLIVVVIIGILAAIAIPKFSSTREKAYYSAVKSDLRNLSTQQEIYHSTYYTYASDDTDLNLGFARSNGVSIEEISGDETGWYAVAKHEGLGDKGCAVYYGNVSTPPETPGGEPTTDSGVMVCDDGTTGTP